MVNGIGNGNGNGSGTGSGSGCGGGCCWQHVRPAARIRHVIFRSTGKTTPLKQGRFT